MAAKGYHELTLRGEVEIAHFGRDIAGHIDRLDAIAFRVESRCQGEDKESVDYFTAIHDESSSMFWCKNRLKLRF